MAVSLDDLVGECWLSSVDFGTERVQRYGDEYEDANSCSFTVNGTTYVAIEDPSDGYRSSLEELKISTQKPVNVFPPVQCVGIKKPSDWHANEVLQLYEVKTGKLVFEVGTENSDDYYPSYVAVFHPGNMPVNADTAEPRS